eukprot:jgi/Mesvir1/27587/Mv07332-RA.1
MASAGSVHTTGSSVEVEVARHVLTSWLRDEDPGMDLSSDGDGPQQQGQPSKGPTAELVRLKLFSGNDYMGLSSHEAVREAAANAGAQLGLGPRASALVCGYTTLHQQLEQALAKLKGTEDCLLFPTGFAANLAVVTALCAPGRAWREGGAVAIFSDELNHASIIDGTALARFRYGAELHVYRHNDLRHLEALLRESQAARKVVITDSLFSMDGDVADLAGLATLRRKYKFLLVLDEAHATCVYGKHGEGLAHAAGVHDQVDLSVGTLSKAVGCLGGFVACSSAWKAWLLNRGRSYIYSTALPLPVVAAALASVNVSSSSRGDDLRARLWGNIHRLCGPLGIQAQSPIIPIVLGSEEQALSASRHLLECGFHVPAIRPPTVAPGTSRLRVTVSAAHSPDDIDQLVETLRPLLANSPSFGSIVQMTPVVSQGFRPAAEFAEQRFHAGPVAGLDDDARRQRAMQPLSARSPAGRGWAEANGRTTRMLAAGTQLTGPRRRQYLRTQKRDL